MRALLALGLAVTIVGCAAPADEPDDAVMSDDAALSALEGEIGFDGAVARLDVTALEAVDADARRLEAAGGSEAEVDALAKRQTLRAALDARSASASTKALHLDFDLYDSDLFKLNAIEQGLCRAHPIVCVRVAIAAFQARGSSQVEYHDGNVGGRIDCFRHTYWNAAMTRSVGAEHAKEWADAHESGYPENRATAKDRLLSDMDLFNNDVGRKIGQAHADDSDDATKQAVRKAIESGDLRAVRYDLGDRNGKLVPSSQCSATVHCGT